MARLAQREAAFIGEGRQYEVRSRLCRLDEPTLGSC